MCVSERGQGCVITLEFTGAFNFITNTRYSYTPLNPLSLSHHPTTQRGLSHAHRLFISYSQKQTSPGIPVRNNAALKVPGSEQSVPNRTEMLFASHVIIV